MIVCLEGPSAVGKSTTASALAASGGVAIAEANVLFARPADEAPDWYLERQVERWAIAARAPGLAILDGDPFQPLWYNWTYGFARQSLDELAAFYRPRLADREIGWPHLYFVLGAGVDALRERKAGDSARPRRGFEMHLRFVEPQRRYFEAMRRFSPDRVRFVDASDVAETVKIVSAALPEARAEARPVELFDQMIRWLRDSRP